MRAGGYVPQDYRSAYNVNAVGDGTGQTVGFTLWGTALPQQDLTAFANATGTTAVQVGGSGANGIEFIPVNGGSTDTNELVETALDVESAHGIANNVHMKYWLGDCTPNAAAGSCNPSDVGLEQAISAAANDSSVHVVSNSWGGGEATSASDPFVVNTNNSFQHAAAVGTTFYFSTGDQGAYSGSGGPSFAASYPSDSPYVVAVGGTNLQTTPNGSTYTYASESTWSCTTYTACTSSSANGGTGGSGGGCSTVFARPSWQIGVTAASCGNRAEPDISADADPQSGALVYVDNSAGQVVHGVVGGTSLAAPLWTGMAADVNRYLGANGQALMGFSAPRIYQLANNPTTYARDFHDVTTGSNGYAAGTGWDQATGWGSPNLANLAADWAGTVPAPTATSVALPTVTPVPATATSRPATATPIPATATSRPATATPIPATATPRPATATATPRATVTTVIMPTSTATTPASATPTSTATNTPVASSTALPPTATATATAVPATATRTPVPATATPVSGNIIVTPGFESGPGVGWAESSSGGYELIDTTRPHTGAYSAYLCGYNNCTDYVQQTIKVPSGANLRYYWYLATQESGATPYDYLRVQLYTTGGTLIRTLRTMTNASVQNTWTPDTVSLSNYAGQTVVLRFVGTTDSSLPTQFFIDDVMVP